MAGQDLIALFAILALIAVVVWLAASWRGEARRHATLERSIPQIERRARDHALKTSDGVRLGRMAEQLVPFLHDFPYSPQDAHFLGRPIDFVVFDGLAEGCVRRVVFVEVKSGKKKALDPRQRGVHDCIVEGRVEFMVVSL